MNRKILSRTNSCDILHTSNTALQRSPSDQSTIGEQHHFERWFCPATDASLVSIRLLIGEDKKNPSFPFWLLLAVSPREIRKDLASRCLKLTELLPKILGHVWAVEHAAGGVTGSILAHKPQGPKELRKSISTLQAQATQTTLHELNRPT